VGRQVAKKNIQRWAKTIQWRARGGTAKHEGVFNRKETGASCNWEKNKRRKDFREPREENGNRFRMGLKWGQLTKKFKRQIYATQVGALSRGGQRKMVKYVPSNKEGRDGEKKQDHRELREPGPGETKAT